MTGTAPTVRGLIQGHGPGSLGSILLALAALVHLRGGHLAQGREGGACLSQGRPQTAEIAL